MSLNKRIKGDYTIESIDSGNKIIMHQAGGITIAGDLTVTGTSTAVESVDTTITDNTLTLNAGESGPGVSLGTAGIEVDRGDGVTAGEETVGIRYNETTDIWEATDNGTAYYPLDSGLGTGIDNVVEDLTPQLGGALDVNGQSIVSVSNGDIVLAANGTGAVQLDSDLMLKEQAGDETPLASYNKLYAKAVGAGGSGLYFSNLSETDELVSKKKAIVYGIIF